MNSILHLKYHYINYNFFFIISWILIILNLKYQIKPSFYIVMNNHWIGSILQILQRSVSICFLSNLSSIKSFSYKRISNYSDWDSSNMLLSSWDIITSINLSANIFLAFGRSDDKYLTM